MMVNRMIGLLAGGAVMLFGCLVLADAAREVRGVRAEREPPQRAEDVQPLEAGAEAPTARVQRMDGEAVEMAELYREKPTMLVFYRGGWCPYCSVQLGHLAEAEGELVAMGYQVLAVSPDRPEALREGVEKGEADLRYELLSDSGMELAQKFGVAFRVDDETVERYRGFGIDLAQAAGSDHHLLPVPAVYLIDTEGMIRYAHWDADYKERLEPEELLAAAREAATEGQR
jgi:peroxiredoxin